MKWSKYIAWVSQACDVVPSKVSPAACINFGGHQKEHVQLVKGQTQ